MSARTHAPRGFQPESRKSKSKVQLKDESDSQKGGMMARKISSGKSSTQYVGDAAALRLERLAERLGVAQGRVLDALLSARTDEQLAAYIEAQEYRADPTKPIPVLLDGPVVASMAGAITQSVSSLLGSALPEMALQVLASYAERRPEVFAGLVNPIVDRLVPHVLDRLIAEQLRAELP